MKGNPEKKMTERIYYEKILPDQTMSLFHSISNIICNSVLQMAFNVLKDIQQILQSWGTVSISGG